MPDEEERIREFAYRIWMEEGYPVGQHERHWDEAKKAIEAENEERTRIAVGVDGPEKRPRMVGKPAA